MKILLLGEFSSLYKNLKEGLEELDHEVVTISSGDGYRKIRSDISLSSKLPGLLGKLHTKLKPLMIINELKGFDVVQVINPFIFYHRFFPNKFFYKFLRKHNNKLFFSAAGDDAYFWKFGRVELKYGPFEDFLKYDLKSNSYFLMSKKAFNLNNYLISKSNGIIPIMYEYEISYKDNPKTLSTIPIPINTSKVNYTENIVKDKLVIFHGLTRYGFKGTRHIEAAYDILRKKYPDELELIIDGGMSLDEYLKTINRANIIIDQSNSYSLGVNGVYSLAMGKVVIGGAEPESLISHNIISSPVINIKPNAKSIVQAVEYLLQNRSKIPSMGLESRKYAEDVHDYVKIAKKYIEVWESA